MEKKYRRMVKYAIVAENPIRIVEYDDFHFAIFSSKKEAEKQKIALEAWLFGIKILYEDFVSPYKVINL